jgi:O-antigen/teichoic acid export membrane protein
MQVEPLPTLAVSESPATNAAAPHHLSRMQAAALHSVARHAPMLATVATSLSVVGLNAVQGILLARLLGPSGRGAYSAVTFYTQTLVFIGLFGSTYVLARRAARAGNQLGPLRNAAVRYSLFSGAATLVAVWVLASVALPAEKRHLLPLCFVCACLLPIEHLRRTLLAIDQGAGRFSRYNAGQLLNAAALPLLLVSVWAIGNAPLNWVIGLTIIAPCIGLLLCGVLGRTPRLSWSPASPSVAVLAREGKPYWLSVVVDDLFGRLDMLLILWLASLPVQGYYAAAVPAAGLLCSAPSALALFTFNAGAKASGTVPLKKVLGLAGSVVALQSASALLLAWLLKPVMLLVYGSRFEAAVPFALALLPANALYGCTQVAEGYLRGRNRNRMSIWSRLLACLSMAAAAMGLWPTWQMMSIPAAFAVGQATILLCLSAAVLSDIRERGTR